MAGKGAGGGSALTEWKSKAEKLEQEKSGLLERLRQREETFKKEVAGLREKMAAIVAEKDRAGDEEELLKAVSVAIVGLYREIKDRTATKVSDDVEEEHKKLLQANPMVVLSYLKTHLRFLLASHEDQEVELRAQLRMAADDSSRNESTLKGRVSSALEREARAIALANGATARLEDAELAKDAALGDTRGLLEQVKSDQLLLVQQLRTKGEENEKLQKVIIEKDKQLKRQETKMLQMAKLESEIQSLKAENLLERKKLEAQHQAKTAHFQSDIQRLTKLEAENDRYFAQIRQMEKELASARTSHSIMQLQDEQAKSARLEALFQKNHKKVEEMEIKVKMLENTAEKYAAEAEQAREKYRALFEAVESQAHENKKKTAKVETKKKAEELSIVYYRDLVKDKDKEIAKLMSRNKRMQRVEVSSQLMEKRFEEQKSEMALRLGKVQQELEKEREAKRDFLLSVPHGASDTVASLSNAMGEAVLSQEHLPGSLNTRQAPSIAPSLSHGSLADSNAGEVAAKRNNASSSVQRTRFEMGSSSSSLGGAYGVSRPVSAQTQQTVSSRPQSAMSSHRESSHAQPAVRPLSAVSRQGSEKGGGRADGAGRPLSAMSRLSGEARGGASSRPTSAMSRRLSYVSSAGSDEEELDVGPLAVDTTEGAVYDECAGMAQPSAPAQPLPRRPVAESFREDESVVGKMAQLQEQNKRMSSQLKHFHNVLSVSQGAADAYKAVVAKLQQVEQAASKPAWGEPAEPENEHDNAVDVGGNKSAGVSKLAGARRGEVARARMGQGGEVAGYKPPRPQSAPPNHHPGMSGPNASNPSSRASEANTPKHGGAPSSSKASPMSSALVGGRPSGGNRPRYGNKPKIRPASAMANSPPRWN